MNRNSLRNGINARLLKLAENYMDLKYGARKRAVFRRLPGTIVEIGPGTGANFRYYTPKTRVIAVEPSQAMYPFLEANALKWDVDLEIRGLKGEEMDLENDSVDAVVSTLVLCTVENPARVIAEILRILKRGGRYVFLEHIAAADGTSLRRVQDILHKPWRWITEGCHLNRSTHTLLLEGGFSQMDMDCFMLESPALPVTPHIFGMAIK